MRVRGTSRAMGEPTFEALPPAGPGLLSARPGPDLAAAGFAESEHVVRGVATCDVGPADFATRVLLRAPVDPAAFDGVLVVEWLNVSSGNDAAPAYTYLADEIVRRGHAWLGISAQYVGVEGGRASVDAPTGPSGLRRVDGERYGDLHHPGDAYCFDIFGRVAAAVGAPGAPLAALGVRRRIAVGQSQSAFGLTTYLDTVAAGHGVFDGYLVHSRGRYGLGPGRAGEPIDLERARRGPTVLVPAELTVPVITVQTETEVLSPRFRSVEARQEDGPWSRLWEVAGTAHADLWQIGEFESLLGCPEPVNRGQQAYVLRAALRALTTWDSPASAPPSAPRLAVRSIDPPAYDLDEIGNVRGGVRTPCVEAPTQQLSGFALPEASALCSLFGATRPVPAELLRARYASVDDYLMAYADATDALITDGFALPEDRDALLAAARPDLVAAAVWSTVVE